MRQETVCHLGNGTLHGIPCPQGISFEVKGLYNNGGTTVCPNKTCPYQQAKTQEGVKTILVGSIDSVKYTLIQKS